MPPKSIKKAIKDTLENLGRQDFNKFCSALVDREEKPRVPRSKVEDKDFLVVTDVLVSTFCDSGALQVTLELLKEINCNEDAKSLEAATRGLFSEPQASSGTDEHFVDRHRLALIERVNNIGPLLDDLLDKKVIQQETYDTILALPTTQARMRELYSALKGGPACKDIFYDCLVKREPYLIEDLKKVV